MLPRWWKCFTLTVSNAPVVSLSIQVFVQPNQPNEAFLIGALSRSHQMVLATWPRGRANKQLYAECSWTRDGLKVPGARAVASWVALAISSSLERRVSLRLTVEEWGCPHQQLFTLLHSFSILTLISDLKLVGQDVSPSGIPPLCCRLYFTCIGSLMAPVATCTGTFQKWYCREKHFLALPLIPPY